MATRCARCGQPKNPDELQMIVSWNGKKMVPVCRDDRECRRGNGEHHPGEENENRTVQR